MEHQEFQRRVLVRIAASRSRLAPLFVGLARLRRARSRVIRLICDLEGGPMWSATFRELMRTHYDVAIGSYSYGPSLFPGGLPPGTRIGNYCSLASGVTVFRRNHPTRRFSQHPFFFNAASGLVEDDTIQTVRDHPLIVEDDVWMGANVIITPRCGVIGLGSVIGAGAVVTEDVPPFAIVAGIPARRIGERFSPEIQRVVMASRWWEYPIQHLIPLLPLFFEDARMETAQRLREHLCSVALTH